VSVGLGLMSEGFVSLPSCEAMQAVSRRRLLLGPLAVLMTLIVLFLTSSVHVTHTCHPHRAPSPTPASSIINRADLVDVPGHRPADGTCLACMLIDLLNTILAFILCLSPVLALIDEHNRQFFPVTHFSVFVISVFPVRAPPVRFLQ